MSTTVADNDKQKALEAIALDLGRLQGLAKTADETFVAFLIASAQREATSRCQELIGAREREPT